MKSTFKSVAVVVGGLLSSAGAFAAPGPGFFVVPEPGSLPLVALGVVGAAVAARFFKKK